MVQVQIALHGELQMNKFDVSVVLNLHRESLFMKPTLLSLSECAREASLNGVNVELIAVFDRSDQATRAVFDAHDFSAFSKTTSIDVDVGSLGLARNAGISCASGEFIWTCDADDLVSSNCIVELLKTARAQEKSKVAVFVEYLCAFGEQYHNVRYIDGAMLTPADFAFQHPYVSRIFLPRSAFKELSYQDLKVTSGFAYEDWDLNCRLYALDYDFLVAKGTTFFYRQRAGSLLRQANAASARMIPHSPLFDHDVFLTRMHASRSMVRDWDEFMRSRREIFDSNNTHSFMASEEQVAHLHEAAALEPEIEPHRVETADSYSPVPWSPAHWGIQMEGLYKLIGQSGFTDVVVLPWLKPGGAEKYILQILHEIKQLGGSDVKVLVVTGQVADKHEWVNRLPDGSVFLDIYNAFPSLSAPDMNAMLVRAMLALCRDGARLHMKSAPFAHDLLDAYGPILSGKFKIIYYRFSDGKYPWRSNSFRGPWGTGIMRKNIGFFWKVINDCDAIAKLDKSTLGTLQEKYETIYAKCEVGRARTLSHPVRRLLWASRISAEKKPELLAEIAHSLRSQGLDIDIHAYGNPDSGVDIGSMFPSDGQGVRYLGPFSSFTDLPVHEFDAFLYTTEYDGLPNVVLEAMGAGLPVIAPNVGGINEAVKTGETGWLLSPASDAGLVEAYVEAIKDLYENWPERAKLSAGAQAHIERQHGSNVFSERVRAVLGAPSDPPK